MGASDDWANRMTEARKGGRPTHPHRPRPAIHADDGIECVGSGPTASQHRPWPAIPRDARPMRPNWLRRRRVCDRNSWPRSGWWPPPSSWGSWN